ncbi:MAG: hypothetical protein ABL907_07100 [Hyphomicrobium sp.]
MYLISQLWWYLLLAFLLGALLGYVLWRACGRRRLQTNYDRMRRDLGGRVEALENERAHFSAAAGDIERENVRLKSDLKKIRDEAAGPAKSQST